MAASTKLHPTQLNFLPKILGFDNVKLSEIIGFLMQISKEGWGVSQGTKNFGELIKIISVIYPCFQSQFLNHSVDNMVEICIIRLRIIHFFPFFKLTISCIPLVFRSFWWFTCILLVSKIFWWFSILYQIILISCFWIVVPVSDIVIIGGWLIIKLCFRRSAAVE